MRRNEGEPLIPPEHEMQSGTGQNVITKEPENKKCSNMNNISRFLTHVTLFLINFVEFTVLEFSIYRH